MQARISEIFQSIQGEGKYTGVKQVFVRFYGCNLSCDWCDTPKALGDDSGDFKEMKAEEVVAEVDTLWKGSHSVSLTGGEPLLQKDFIKELAPLLRKKNMPVYLETNGVLYEGLKEVIDHIDFISMDMKLPSSAKCEPFWEEHELFLRTAIKDKSRDVFVKAVVSSDTHPEDMERAVDLMRAHHPDGWFIIQPNALQLENGVLKKIQQFQDYALKYISHARVMPQMHKILQVR